MILLQSEVTGRQNKQRKPQAQQGGPSRPSPIMGMEQYLNGEGG